MKSPLCHRFSSIASISASFAVCGIVIPSRAQPGDGSAGAWTVMLTTRLWNRDNDRQAKLQERRERGIWWEWHEHRHQLLPLPLWTDCSSLVVCSIDVHHEVCNDVQAVDVAPARKQPWLMLEAQEFEDLILTSKCFFYQDAESLRIRAMSALNIRPVRVT